MSKADSKMIEIQGFALRVIRESRGRKPADPAAALDCDRSYITKIELGHSRRVSPTFYSALLAELQIVDYRALLAQPFGASHSRDETAVPA